jgi:hypothetical protein
MRRLALLLPCLLAALAAAPAARADLQLNTVKLPGAGDGTEPRVTITPDDRRWAITNTGTVGGTAVVYGSSDGGASWQRTAADPTQTSATIDTDIVAMHTGRILASELDDAGINFPTSTTDDFGKTWTASHGSEQLADQDRQWFAVGPDDPTTHMPRVYLLFHNLASGEASHNMWVATSTDGGQTFGAPVPTVLPGSNAWTDLQCADSGGPSDIQVNQKTGRIYVFFTTRSSTPTAGGPNTGGCGASVFGPPEFNIVNATRVWAVSSPDGSPGSWTQSLAVDDSPTGQIVSMQLAYGALDNQGNVYVAYPESPKPYPDAGGAALKLVYSGPDMKSWSKPVTFVPAIPSADLGVTLVHLAAGDPGKVDAAFYEAKHLPGVDKPVWYTHVVQSLNVRDAHPTFTNQEVADIPAYRWTASEMMGICGPPGPEQGVYNGTACSRSTDVWGITLDAQCRLVIAWPTFVDPANTSPPSPGSTYGLPGANPGTFVTTQTGGPTLCSGNNLPGGVAAAAYNRPAATGAAGSGPGGGSGRPGAACPDRVAPVSRTTRIRATRRGIHISGRSSDRGCRGRATTASGLRGVSVAIGRAVGRQCRYLRADGSFGPRVSCLRTTYMVARGTARWSFDLRAQLPAGRYVVWVRGIDRANNVERKQRRVNLARTRIR